MPDAAPSTPHFACPKDIETLTQLLLRDLPNYANRVSQRSRHIGRTIDINTYVLLAGRPEFTPLTLGLGEYDSVTSVSDPESLQQVFITTLERQYLSRQVVELQDYHWLFLTQTESGWQLAMMFSRTGPYPGGSPPSPPRDSFQGIIGLAIQDWLNDCRAGIIRS